MLSRAKFVNHPANEVLELKTAEQWGLLRTTTSTKEKSAGACGEVIWNVQKPQNEHELILPQGFLHCLLDHQELLALEPQVTRHQGWLQEEQDEDGVKQTFRNIPVVSKALPKFAHAGLTGRNTLMAMSPKRNPISGHCQCLQILFPKLLWRWNQPWIFLCSSLCKGMFKTLFCKGD